MSSTATAADVMPQAPSRPVPGSRRQHVARRFPKLPFLVSRLFFIGAIVLIAQALLPGVYWISSVVDAYSTVFIPIDGGTIGFAIFLIILGGALARRKQAGWVIAMVIFSLSLLGDLFLVGVLVWGVVTEEADYPSLPLLARFGFNLAALGSLTACMVVYRAEFTARRQPGSVRKALITLLVGLGVTFGVAMLLVTIFPNELVGPRGRLVWIAKRLELAAFGPDTNFVPQSVSAPPSWINTVVGLLFGLTLLASIVALMRSQRRASVMSAEDEPRVRALVAESPEDSLAYFATRRDKSVVFAANGRSAITYRVDLGVCLASSDPIGPPDHWPAAIKAWQDLLDTYGWTPAVIGASEAGATAYAQAGLRVIRLGDEAILETREFHLDGRDMRPVRQAVQRLERMGYRTRVRLHADIPDAELVQLIGKIDAWRDTETERGFSMALGRLGDPTDANCLMVEALFPPSRPAIGPMADVAGVLSFVPWGTDGFSLDVMRRHPDADNGVTEFMVTGLMAAGREIGIRRVSLNFAVFRSAFEEGARIGAGPIVRLWRRLLLVASRWWQIESLYRSNVKYRPEWQPRFLCFAETRDIALVGAASGLAEGFIDLPTFPEAEAHRCPGADQRNTRRAARYPAGTRRPAGQRRRSPGARADPAPDGRPGVPARRGCRPVPAVVPAEPGDRRTPAGHDGQHRRPGLGVRDLGGVIFVKLRDWSGDAQLLLSEDHIGKAAMDRLRRVVDLGDHLGAEGDMVLSRSGDLSMRTTSWLLTAKSLRPLPDKHRGISDPETRVRQRYLDLAVNPAARRRLITRSAVIRAVRNTLDDLGFLEVETPILQTIHGGANARPFRTHINAYDLELYLRIAPELYLKRLMVGGVDKLFEIGRNFRNEGADATHNPEFTMLEVYQAYGDYTTMRVVAQQLIIQAARAATGGTVVGGTDHHGDLARC